jgi:hypothetical protein
MMIDCKHNRTLLITGSRGSGGRENAYICADCGEIHVFADSEGKHFSMHFSLYGSAHLIAASQAHRRLAKDVPEGERLSTRVWKPLDFGHLRLYKVLLSWSTNDHREYQEQFIVAADSPNQSPQSAANLIKKIYAETYENNSQIAHWDVKGYPLQVLQPLEWTENGISLLNEDLRVATERMFRNLDDGKPLIGAFRQMWRALYGDKPEPPYLVPAQVECNSQPEPVEKGAGEEEPATTSCAESNSQAGPESEP